MKSDACVGPIFFSFPVFKGTVMADRDKVRLTQRKNRTLSVRDTTPRVPRGTSGVANSQFWDIERKNVPKWIKFRPRSRTLISGNGHSTDNPDELFPLDRCPPVLQRSPSIIEPGGLEGA